MRSFTSNTSQLLQGFLFDKSSHVLQIGPCDGELTRYLGEYFQSVVCLEPDTDSASKSQSYEKHMENVSVICAPFQGTTFRETFDIIFSIGSIDCCNNGNMDDGSLRKAFMSASELLKPDGVFILAINAQHLGYKRIKELLAQQFHDIRYYYPIPEFSAPACILSEELLNRARLDELVAGFLSKGNILSDESPAMADSDDEQGLFRMIDTLFVVAGKQSTQSVRADWLAIMYAKQRIPSLQTVTRIYEDDNGALRVNKTPRYHTGPVHLSKLTLHPLDSPWIDGISLHQQILMNCSEQGMTLEDIFSPCKIWIDTMRDLCVTKGEDLWIDGRYIDSIWKNCMIVDSQCRFFDYEWEWNESIPFRPFLIRALMYFLSDAKLLDAPASSINFKPVWRLCVDIAGMFGIRLQIRDFAACIALEGELQKIVTNTPRIKTDISLVLFLVSIVSAGKWPEWRSGLGLKTRKQDVDLE